MSHRPGDVATPIGALRLTVGALAELAEQLDAPGPEALAHRMRTLSVEDGRTVVRALLRPCSDAGAVSHLTDRQVASLLPDAARCIVTALEKRS
ncbi:MAG: GTA-gp10 family protein [Pseudomonadota bacterium]